MWSVGHNTYANHNRCQVVNSQQPYPLQIREVSQGKTLGLLSTTTTLSGNLDGLDNNVYEVTGRTQMCL
jgi:hypothetical protein